jgi:hypothetical protein
VAQPVKQHLRGGIEVLPQFGIGTVGDFVDGEFAGEQAAGIGQGDERLGVWNFTGVQ